MNDKKKWYFLIAVALIVGAMIGYFATSSLATTGDAKNIINNQQKIKTQLIREAKPNIEFCAEHFNYTKKNPLFGEHEGRYTCLADLSYPPANVCSNNMIFYNAYYNTLSTGIPGYICAEASYSEETLKTNCPLNLNEIQCADGFVLSDDLFYTQLAQQSTGCGYACVLEENISDNANYPCTENGYVPSGLFEDPIVFYECRYTGTNQDQLEQIK